MIEKIIQALTTKILTQKIQDYGEVVVHPEGYKVTRVTPETEKPRRIDQKLVFWSYEGWAAYVKKWAGPNTVVLASRINLVRGGDCLQKLVAIFDYHASAKDPEWCSHTATLRIEYSQQMMAWIRKCNAWIGQEDFAMFIEERSGDITEPSPASMAAMALNVEASIGGKITAKRDMNNLSSVTLITDNQAIPTMEIPRNISISLPMFEGEALHTVHKVLLRYSFKDSDPKFQLVLPRLIGTTITGLDRMQYTAANELNTKILGGDI